MTNYKILSETAERVLFSYTDEAGHVITGSRSK